MNKKSFWVKKIYLLLFASILIFMTGCQNSPTAPSLGQNSTYESAMLKAVESDSAVASFEPIYNEQDAMNILGTTGTAIYPLRVGQKMRVVSSNFSYTMSGDTAFGTYTKNYEGVLYISASYNSTSKSPDTLIQKPFTTLMTRNVILLKVNNNSNDTSNYVWRILAVSLPEGGTLNSNVKITKLSMYLPNGDMLIINDPNDYYLSKSKGHGKKWWKQIPHFMHAEKVTIEVEVSNANPDTDFVTLTIGGNLHGFQREKIKFNLISSTQNGSGYDKVYQSSFLIHPWPGFHNAVINAFPKQVVFDDSTPVEVSTWGVPYYIEK